MTFSFAKKSAAVAAILFWGVFAWAESFVEFIILDKVWPEHKWGHVSLRVKTDQQDLVFDFGRYGQMWGFFNTEGEPILRVWKNANDKHTAFQKIGNPNIHVVRFPATEEEVNGVLRYFSSWTKGVKPSKLNNHVDVYNLKAPAFHSLRHNCTTISIAGFKNGFVNYDVNDSRFAVGDGLYVWARSKANNVDYNSSRNSWDYIWWPKDLLNSLRVQFVSKGLAKETVL